MASSNNVEGASEASNSQVNNEVVIDNVDKIRKIIGPNFSGNLEESKMFAVVPKTDCEHLSEINRVPDGGINVELPCEICQNVGENWVCLTCYKVFCSRFVKEHMVQHSIDMGHAIVLSFADLSSWCYKCEEYIHNDALTEAKKSAHFNKFKCPLPLPQGKNTLPALSEEPE